MEMRRLEFCWVRSCPNYRCCNKNVDLYPLPSDPDERALWSVAFGLTKLEVNRPEARVCGTHFRRKYFLPSSQIPLTANEVTPPVSPQTPCIVRANPANHQISQNKTLNIDAASASNSISDQSNKKTQTFSISTVFDSCELFCQEESLTPEQEKFQYEEWLNYVKFSAKIDQLPFVTAVNGSEVGETILTSNKSLQALPVLVYSNVTQQPQTLHASSVTGPVPAAQIFTSSVPGPVPQAQIFTSVPGPVAHAQIFQSTVPGSIPQAQVFTSFMPNTFSFSSNSVTNDQVSQFVNPVTPAVKPVSLIVNNSSHAVDQCNIPSALPSQSSVFPVRLEKNIRPTLEKNSASQNSEEIFPLFAQDSSFAGLQNHQQESLPLEEVNKSISSSSPSVSSGNETCVSPDLLCNVEVNFEEKEEESLPCSLSANAPALLGSDTESDNSNGPKIVDVSCGDDAVKEFYEGIVPVNNEEKSDQQKVYFTTIDGTIPPGNSMPRTVTDWSIFSMQKTIAVISSGSVEPSIHNLLGVRIHIPPITTERDIPTKLKNTLRSEHFLTLAPWWMIQKGYLPLNSPCVACGSKSFHLNSCSDYLDNLCWLCDNSRCQQKYPVKRPKFFERFPSFTLEELLLLTYHWACKSRIWVIHHDVPVHEERVWEYFNALQELCGKSVSQNRFIGMSDKNMLTVEVSAVKLGKFFILCAFDRRSKLSRLKVLTTEEACNSLKHLDVLQEWLGDNCRVITWKKISDDYLPNVVKLGADPTIGHIQSPGRHILNASKYLGKTAVTLFQNICHAQLTVEIVQRVLDEVQWRERHGKNEELTFWNILFEIASSNTSGETTATLGEFSKDRYYYKSDMPFRLRWGPLESSVKSIFQTQPVSNLSIKNRNLEKAPTTYTVSKKPIDSPQQALSKNMYLSVDQVITIPSTVIPSYVVSEKDNSKGKKHPISIPPLPSNCGRERGFFDARIRAKDFLTVKIFFNSDESHLNDYRLQAKKLGNQLKEEGYLKNPIWWLAQKRYIRDASKCYACQSLARLRENPKFSDGVSWVCQKNSFENKYQRPSFFSLGFKLEVIFAIIYHWAVQSDYHTLIKAIPMNEFNIIGVHRKLQKICSEIKKLDKFQIGGKKSLVEIALVRIGNCFILGAMQRNTYHSRFRAFSSDTKLHVESVRETLVSWICAESVVIVNSNKYLGRYSLEKKIQVVFADKDVTDVNSTKYHTLTITNYLQNHVKCMFQSVNVQDMSAELLQIYLDELMWRERYGKGPADSFYSIFSCIFAVEYKDPNYQTHAKAIRDSILIKKAASYYGFLLPMPELKVELVKLPDHLILQYTTQGNSTYGDSTEGSDDITIIDDFVRKNDVKEEIILDDEVEILPAISNTESASTFSSVSASIAPTTEVSASVSLPSAVSASLASISKVSSPIASISKAVSPVASISKASSPVASISIASSPVASISIASISITSIPVTSISVASTPIAPPPIASLPIASPQIASPPIASPIIASPIIASPPIASTSSSDTKLNMKTETPFASVKFHRKMKNASAYSKNLNSYNVYKRYSDKCYSRKRKSCFVDGKSRCIECKDIITEDHFAKQYSCSDCKCYVYTTFCQRAFARHRSYILFGRKICNDSLYNKNTYLPQKWYCSCGYGSKDGNKLAFHLVECQKSTCYLESVQLETEELIDVLS